MTLYTKAHDTNQLLEPLRRKVKNNLIFFADVTELFKHDKYHLIA